ncbi:MAG: hypothetical protein JJV98_10720 [Desulfosarcina sp.]|nr:hypothetical protein [Desulfobacterales bacterium]
MVVFNAPNDALPVFRSLFQKGVGITIQTGTSLENLLCCQWNIDRAYVMGRISTLFLDGHPVDDLPGAVVHDGATLALSGAMPGLIGATMRRGGVLASFRDGITYCETSEGGHGGRGRITLKLFNLLIEELGPLFLARGIWVSRSRLAELFPGHPGIANATDSEIEVYMADRPSAASKGARKKNFIL